MSDPAKPMFGDPIGPWRLCFAWLPVRTYDDQVIWLRRVERRRIQLKLHLWGPGPDRWWQYRRPGDDA